MNYNKRGKTTFKAAGSNYADQSEVPIILPPTEEELLLERQLQEEAKKKINSYYEEWLVSDLHSEYKNHIPIIPGHVIIRVFFYSSIEQSTLILDESVKRSTYKVYPIAKVLSIGTDTSLQPGDLITIPARMSINQISEEWINYQKLITEQPSMRDKMPQPPMFYGMLKDWVQYMYKIDPITPISKEDEHTFCLPERLLQTKRV